MRSEPKGSLDWLAAHATSDLDGEGVSDGKWNFYSKFWT